MAISKVVIEISTDKRLPKKVLEQMVMHFAAMKVELVSPFSEHDDKMSCRVYYEDNAGVPQISLLKLFRLGRAHAKKV